MTDVLHVARGMHGLLVDGRGDHGGELSGHAELRGALHGQDGMGATGGMHGTETEAGRPADADVDQSHITVEFAGFRQVGHLRYRQSGGRRAFGKRPAAADQDQRRTGRCAHAQGFHEHFRPDSGGISHRDAQRPDCALPSHGKTYNPLILQ